MKKSLKSKKGLYLGLFAIIVVIIVIFNAMVFPSILSLYPSNSSINHASVDEVDLQSANKILGNIISEDTAIKNAQNALNKENDLLANFDIENSQVLSQYVYDSNIPNQSLWVIIFFNTYENYTYEMPKEISPEMISEDAWKTGEVWMNKEGKIFAHYDYRREYVIVEIDAASGEYHGYKTAVAEFEDDEENVAEWLKEMYNIDFEL